MRALAAPDSHRLGRADRELTRIAFHEAGHAIVAAHLGYAVRPVSLLGPARGALSLYTDPALGHPERIDAYAEAVRNAIAVFLAGPLAEERRLGFAPMWPPKRCRVDYLHAANMAAALHTIREVREALVPAGERRVRAYLRQRDAWQRVSHLAATLLGDYRAAQPVRELLAA